LKGSKACHKKEDKLC